MATTTEESAAEQVRVDWRKSDGLNGLAKRFGYILESGFRSDIVFLVGNGKMEIKAHKLILSTGSEIFDKLFSEDMDKNSFEVPDLDPDVFSLLLKYLYTGDGPENIEDVLTVLIAASKYEVFDLIKICGELLSTELNRETAINIFQQSLKYKDAGLEEAALKCICSNGWKIVESDQFLKLNVEELAKILLRDDLTVKNELQLFGAVMNWGRAECERQESPVTQKYMHSVLEKVIHLIRFPLMDPSDFSLKVAPTQVLLTEEVVSVLLYFNVKQSDRVIDFYAASYAALEGDGTSLDLALPGENGSVVTFEFENEEDPKYTRINQGYIPEIGFMIQ